MSEPIHAEWNSDTFLKLLTKAEAIGFRRGFRRGICHAIETLRREARIGRDEHPNNPVMWTMYLASAAYLEQLVTKEETT